jgi:hypothetical protein
MKHAIDEREGERETRTRDKEKGRTRRKRTRREPDDGGVVAKSCLHTVYVSPKGSLG